MITVLSLSPAVDKIYFIDNFTQGELYRVSDYIKSPGGKGINAARVLKMLGANVEVLGFKAGSTGKWLEDCLYEIGVKSHFIKVSGESRTNNNIIDRVNHKETEILEEGPTVSKDEWELFYQEFLSQIQKNKILILTGGLPKGLDICTYQKLIEIANKNNIITVLDAAGEVLEMGIRAKPYLIKPNLRELSNYFNKQFESDNEIIDASREIINGGVKMVVTSLGQNGAILVTKEHVYKQLPYPVEASNTIGCGDSVVAGISSGVLLGLPTIDCFRLGCACAASNAEFMQIGMIDKNRVEYFKNEIIIQELK